MFHDNPMIIDTPIGGLDVDGTLSLDHANDHLRSCISPDDRYHQPLDIERSLPSSNEHKLDGCYMVGAEGKIQDRTEQILHNTPAFQHHNASEQCLKHLSMNKDQYEIFKVLVKNRQFMAAVEMGDGTKAAGAAATALGNLARVTMIEQGRKVKKPLLKTKKDGKLYTPNLVRSLQTEMLELEEVIPWNHVKKIWKNKRAAWRRQVKQTNHISGFATKIKDLKQAMLIDDNVFMGCGPEWTTCLDLCAQDLGSSSQLDSVWDELKTAIHSWIYFTSPVSIHGEIDSLPASIALEALQGAVLSTPSSHKASTLLQVPIESMIGLHSERLLGVRDSLEVQLQKCIVDGKGPRMELENFDSGAETDEEALTDVDETYDVLCHRTSI
jgi:hypothetical protein